MQPPIHPRRGQQYEPSYNFLPAQFTSHNYSHYAPPMQGIAWSRMRSPFSYPGITNVWWPRTATQNFTVFYKTRFEIKEKINQK